MKLFIPVLLLAIQARAELPRLCQTAAVRQVTRALDAGRSFTYRFSVSAPSEKTESGPVVIFIPGGPGQTSMDMPLSYPDDFTVVRTDPRGVGCNIADQLHDEDLNSEQIARDILAIVRELKPKSYILHGTSYGTIVATMAASFAKAEGLPEPVAVVLEGTIGRAFREGEYLQGFFERWVEFKKEAAPEVLTELSRESFLGLERKRWAAWLSAMLTYGKYPDGSSLLVDDLKVLAPGGDEDRRSGLVMRAKKMSETSSPEKIRLYRQISCREFVNDVRDIKYDFDFVRGELVGFETRWCQGIKEDRAFHASDFQVGAPIYYFSGDLDPATPPWQAKAHFDSQKGPRTLVHVENGGHYALSGSLMTCMKDVWRGILRSDISISFHNCPAKVRYEQKN